MTINKSYTITTIAPSILGVKFKNIKLVKILGFKDAVKEDTGITNTNSLVFKSINQTPIPDPSTAAYYIFESPLGEKITLSEIWIDQNSILEEDVISRFRIDFLNISVSDSLLIQQRVRDLGFSSFVASVV